MRAVSVDEVLALWATIAEAARAIGINVNTLKGWRRGHGFVPVWHLSAVLAAMAAQRKKLRLLRANERRRVAFCVASPKAQALARGIILDPAKMSSTPARKLPEGDQS